LTEVAYEKSMTEDRARFVEMAGIRSNFRVLDAGTGHGLFAVCIARKIRRNGLVIAIDVSSEHVKKTKALLKKEKLTDSVYVIKADLRQVPISDNAIDTVMSYNFLCSINIPSALSKVFFEAKRILKNNGKLVAVDFTSKPKDEHENLFFQRFDVFRKVYVHTGDSLHLTFFAAKEIESLLEAIGFSVRTEVIERDIWMPKSVLEKESKNLIKNMKQSKVKKSVMAQLVRELREFYRRVEKEGVKIPDALLINATLRKEAVKIPRIQTKI
jgi:ubiquinone/menaquinone biosynthesis C-methylase UbiE